MNGMVSSKFYNKRDDFNFGIINVPFLDGNYSRFPSCGAYISQLIHLTTIYYNVSDFNNMKYMTANLLKQGNQNHKLRQAFSKLYPRDSELIV